MSGFVLSATTAPELLTRRGIAGPFACRELGGGVSNVVVLVESPAGPFVLKQALPQLRVRDEWLADRNRIFRERDGLLAAASLLPAGWIPKVLWSADEDYLFAMEAFSPEAESWKDELLRGETSAEKARQAGLALGLTVRGSWRNPELERQFGDQRAFDQLRTDPYYRTIARRHPAIADAVGEWVEAVTPLRLALTHGDWSPKNMVSLGERLLFIDYECIHFGDPSYDAAFALNHLILKGVHRSQQQAEYHHLARVFLTWTLAVLPAEALPRFESAAMRHLAFLLLARIDGKSPAEYLRDEAVRDRLRRTALQLIADRPSTLEGVLATVERFQAS